MDCRFNGKKIKQVVFCVGEGISFLTETKNTYLQYHVDYRGEYELCWICTIDKVTGKEIKRSSDKNVSEIIWKEED